MLKIQVKQQLKLANQMLMLAKLLRKVAKTVDKAKFKTVAEINEVVV